MITVVDYGLGNLGSIRNMLKRIGSKAVVTGDSSVIAEAEKLILPGVGSFDNGMRNLSELGLIQILNKKVIEEKTPILGICLGMQLMTRGSEEGQSPGLQWIEADTVKFSFDKRGGKFTVPHMGWNYVSVTDESGLIPMNEEQRFYFVHSYYVKCDRKEDILCETNYGHPFVSAFRKEKIVGVQFHPEKSHKFGMNLFRNFVNF